MKLPVARSRISASLIGVPVKSKLSMSLARQLGDGQLVLDRARLLLGDLGVEQIADDARRLMPTLDAGGHHLVVGRAHAEELEGGHQLENIGPLHQPTLRSRS
jgi:hypothetical protein